MPPEEAQPLGHVGADRRRAVMAGPEGATQEQQDPGCHEPHARRSRQDQRCTDRHEEPAQRRTDELVRRQLGGVEAPVGPREQPPVHHLRQDRLRRGVVERLGHPDAERDDVQDGDGGHVQRDASASRTSRDARTDVGRQHDDATVLPIGDRARVEREDQPWQPPATARPAISVGSRVYWIAISGSATLKMPSARLDSPADDQSRQ